jgi:hypothetical protein
MREFLPLVPGVHHVTDQFQDNFHNGRSLKRYDW